MCGIFLRKLLKKSVKQAKTQNSKKSIDIAWDKLKQLEKRLEKEQKLTIELQKVREENKLLKKKIQKKDVEIMHMKIVIKKEQDGRMRIRKENANLLIEKGKDQKLLKEMQEEIKQLKASLSERKTYAKRGRGRGRGRG